MTQKAKTIKLEEYLTEGEATDAVALRKKLGLTFNQLQQEISKARQRGCIIVYVNNKILFSLNKMGFERALIKQWEENIKTEKIEFRK